MGHFIDCQIALVPWGANARFRLGKVGLLRKGEIVFIAIVSRAPWRIGGVVSSTGGGGNSNTMAKFPLVSEQVEVLPAAIRFKDIRRDLFIRQASDEAKLSTMIREIKVILKREKLKQNGKAEVFKKLVATIPLFSSVSVRDLSMSSSGSASACTKLELTNCNLSSVPKQLETFSNTLTILVISNNNIKQIPRTFCCKMKLLSKLDLSHNQIETLPIEIKFLRNLDDLNISNNRLRMLPSTFSDLRCLRELNLAYNNLSQLPAFRMGDIKLRRLDVSYNPLDGALNNEYNTFEVKPLPSFDYDDNGYGGNGPIDYNENLLGPNRLFMSQNKFPKLFELALLRVVRCDKLLRLASEESLPRTIVSTIQRDVFKCFRCNRMNMFPAYNSTDILDYVAQVETLLTSGNYRHGMTFMKLVCRCCFDNMSS